MDWKQFTEVADTVKKLTTKIQGETDKIKLICKEYNKLLREELATPKECKDFCQLTECLAKIQDDLKNVKEKEASREILIEFVGATSSGKSSLINALLRERRLPVGFMQTTMCSIKVCTTEQEEWSVTATIGNGESVLLSETKDEKAIKDLLSQMSGRKHSENREELGIHTRSIVQVNWPKHLCEVLPLNVVLFDTPGFGEDEESMKVVTQSCREADIIVAVMDAMSPSKATVAKLVKDVNCQFTFGVFTKWDECMKKAKEETEAAVDVEQARRDCEKDFRDALNDQCEVFFVNVKVVGNNDAGFKKFESKLASSATKLKGESLIKQAKFVNVKSTQISERLKDIVNARRDEKIARLLKKLASIDEDLAAFNEMYQNLRCTEEMDILTEDAKEKLLQEFKEGVMSGKSEKEALKQFLKEVNKNIKDSLASKRKEVRDALEKLTENMKHNCDLNMNKMVSNEYPQLRHFENQELPKDQYKWYRDPNYYYTNNYISGCALGGALLAVTATGIGGGVAFVGLMAAETIPFLTGLAGTAGGVGGVTEEVFGVCRIGDKIKKRFPVSNYKVRCWRRLLSRELEEFDKDCRKLISHEIDRIHDNISKKLDSDKDSTSMEIRTLYEESHGLAKWVKQLDDSRKDLEKVRNELETLLARLRKKIERAEEELRRRQMEYDHQVAIMQTFLY